MREIKFRAWDGFYRRMVLVDELHIKTNEIRYSQGFNTLNKFVLMQYTGLKDKNGVEIYEGDTIVVNDSYGRDHDLRHIVVFDEGRFGSDAYSDFEALWSYHTIEVVGNIYENTELLEI